MCVSGLSRRNAHAESSALQTVYLSQGGDPLWFTIGRDSEDLIPTSVFDSETPWIVLTQYSVYTMEAPYDNTSHYRAGYGYTSSYEWRGLDGRWESVQLHFLLVRA